VHHRASFCRVRRRVEIEDSPREISLETISLCNAKCSFCPYSTLERSGQMSGWLLDKLIDEMSEFELPFTFAPFKVNEPLLDPRFFDICRTVENTSLATLRIFTNGSPLTQRHIDNIASLSRVQHLWISLNSHLPDEYEALMSLPFERTVRRLDNLHSQDFPHRVVLSAIGSPNQEFIKYCKNRWPKFDVALIQKASWLGFTDSQVDIVPDIPCGRWWELSIMSNGIVSLCCMDGEGRFPIGDVNKQTMLEVYNSPLYRERRDKEMSRRDVDVCRTCTYGVSE